MKNCWGARNLSIISWRSWSVNWLIWVMWRKIYWCYRHVNKGRWNCGFSKWGWVKLWFVKIKVGEIMVSLKFDHYFCIFDTAVGGPMWYLVHVAKHGVSFSKDHVCLPACLQHWYCKLLECNVLHILSLACAIISGHFIPSK